MTATEFVNNLGYLGTSIPTNPPAGKKKVLNMYWDPALGEFVMEAEP
jgi:hypothetical protein